MLLIKNFTIICYNNSKIEYNTWCIYENIQSYNLLTLYMEIIKQKIEELINGIELP